ncbi:MAG: ribokinase [Alphaproteobacteria bacterium]|nr:ribokinase [Alphaproteobacteria bacterium]
MILVFGSINIDVIFPVARLPRPGETVLGGDYRLLPGGKGANQALAARRAGASVMMAGVVGNDAFAGATLELLRRDGVDLALVQRVARPTGCAAIMVGEAGENLIAVAPGANAMVVAAAVPDEMLGPDTIVLCQIEVPVFQTAALLRRAARRGARCILNLAPAAPIDADLLADIHLLVANETEAAALHDEPASIARRLRQGLVVTHGAAGSTVFRAEGARLDIPALPIDAVDTTGAGDTFAGVLAAGLDRGLTVEIALRRASAAAGLACLAPGAQTAMPDAAAIDNAVARLAE